MLKYINPQRLELPEFEDSEIILISPPFFWLKSPPLALLQLASYLKSYNIKVSSWDLNYFLYKHSGLSSKRWLSFSKDNPLDFLEKNELFKEILKILVKSSARFIGFSCFRSNWECSLYIARYLRENAPGKRFIFGGPEVLFTFYERGLSHLQEEFRDDFFVVGEGFSPLREILTNRFSQKRLFVYQEVENFDEVPYIDFRDEDFNFLGIITSRGCIRRCLFCSECFLYKKVSHLSLYYMKEQLSRVKRFLPKKPVSFQDSMFNMDLDYLDSLLGLFLKEELHFYWEAQIGVRSMPYDLLLKMKNSGCRSLFIGVESFSDKVLASMEKGYTQEDILRFFKNLNKAGLFFEISLICGFPAEEEKDFQETLSFLKRYNKLIPKVAQINPFISYPPSLWVRRYGGQSPEGLRLSLRRVRKLLKVLEDSHIKFTPHFVNNLLCT